MADVHVVGGGPAGCFAGIAACLKGERVLLSEEHDRIGEPEACLGLISKSGLESLLPYVDYRKVKLNEIERARIICGSEEFLISPKEETAILVSRSGLDRLAAERFEREGGKLRLGRKVAGNFEAGCIIGADGPASFVARKFRFPQIRSFVATMQGNFRHALPDPHCAYLHLSSRDSPGFFGWAVPINEGEAKIGLGVSLPRHPLGYYRRFLASLGVKGKPSHEFSAVIPTSVRSRTAMRRGERTILLAGDAAGQVKATTGGGVFFGARCGFLAGKNCGEPAKYEQEWRREYGMDLALHMAMRKALDLAGGAPHPFLLSAAKALLFEDLLSEKGRMDRWGRMLDPAILSDYLGIVGRKSLRGVG